MNSVDNNKVETGGKADSVDFSVKGMREQGRGRGGDRRGRGGERRGGERVALMNFQNCI